MDKSYSIKEALIFSQKIAQLSKALWKVTEKDLQQWIEPFNLNINEFHILRIAYHSDEPTISNVAKLGVMHVSTAFNFSKKLEKRGLLQFSKRENDKRNTYVKITDKGEAIIIKLIESYEPYNNDMFAATIPLKELYGKFPGMNELTAIIRNIYGNDFIDIHEQLINNLEKELSEDNGKIIMKNSINL